MIRYMHEIGQMFVELNKEGGHGIRRIADINEPAGVKMLWRLCTSNNIWANWMNARYVKNKISIDAIESLLHINLQT